MISSASFTASLSSASLSLSALPSISVIDCSTSVGCSTGLSINSVACSFVIVPFSIFSLTVSMSKDSCNGFSIALICSLTPSISAIVSDTNCSAYSTAHCADFILEAFVEFLFTLISSFFASFNLLSLSNFRLSRRFISFSNNAVFSLDVYSHSAIVL